MVDTLTPRQDVDPQETSEWLDALDAVLEHEGPERAHFLLEMMIGEARRNGAYLPYRLNTAYINSISPSHGAKHPGDLALERRIKSLVRWNAMAMVVRANKTTSELGGHISSFASAATLYDVGFNHFWHAPNDEHEGDLIFFQGHSAPGIYARAFVEGRLSEKDLDHFRQESGGEGLSSYPHPWLMPDFWQFPTVSMGLGPIQAIYQARFMKYMHNRGIRDMDGRKVWSFMGDGETDEPESLGAISLAGREGLDNLIFVINCNLQRLDGPVRGNGKIIQELESVFTGAGWNVIKVIWGSYWDPLLATDTKDLLKIRMEEAVDGEYQAYKSKDGAYVREKFFGKYPELKAMVADMSDHDIWRLNRGGHDPHKVYAAYAEAMKTTGQPTVILAKTVKGYGMGIAGEGQNITHSQKKMDVDAIKTFRDRFSIPIADSELESGVPPYFLPSPDSPEMQYLREKRERLGGPMPVRRRTTQALEIPSLDAFSAQLKDSGDREFSSTMAFVRILSTLVRDKKVGRRIVPIIPDEARTFGMEGLFRQLGIYASQGQLYEPEDADQLMYYRESKDGQVLQEGINEAGSMAEWMAAGTAYSNHNEAMIPFYIFYSMFGFQRTGDLAWASGDIQARGFLIGGTAGRTTLAGEGLQHQDGHSLILAGTIPNCVAYDPTFAYEMAVIIQHGMERMFVEQANVFYYITAMNENYHHPEMPDNARSGIIKGLYSFKKTKRSQNPHVQLMGSGAILNEVIAAGKLLKKDWNVNSDVWSATSMNELAREGQEIERWNMLHADKTPRVPYVTRCLESRPGPVVAATDYVRLYSEQIRPYVPARYVTLGTDGFGRSDTRAALRRHFEVNRYYVTLAALKALADEGTIPAATVKQAMEKYEIDPEKPFPLYA